MTYNPDAAISLAREYVRIIDRKEANATVRSDLRIRVYSILTRLEMDGHELPQDLAEWLQKYLARAPTQARWSRDAMLNHAMAQLNCLETCGVRNARPGNAPAFHDHSWPEPRVPVDRFALGVASLAAALTFFVLLEVVFGLFS